MAPNPRRADARLAALYEQVPAGSCSGACHGACCFIEDAVSVRERERVERASGRKLETIDHGIATSAEEADYDPFGNPLARWRCSMLTEDGRCSVYDDRPMICRLFGVTKGIECHASCKPEQERGDGMMMLFDAMEAGGRPASFPATSRATFERTIRDEEHMTAAQRAVGKHSAAELRARELAARRAAESNEKGNA